MKKASRKKMDSSSLSKKIGGPMGTTKQERNLQAEYREIGAGGFSHVDGTLEFYARINALVDSGDVVLDYGAGRGAQLQNSKRPFVTNLAKLQGKVRTVVGVDVDTAVLDNPFLDEKKVVAIGDALPFPDQSFDMIYADWVLEHVDTPALFAEEVYRLLKPGGWFCARTPNRWGMTGIGTNLIPNSLHTKLLSRLQPERQSHDVFPTTYKLNTIGRLGKYFTESRWENFSYYYQPEPPYVQGNRLVLAVTRRAMAVLPAFLRTNLHVFLRKR